MARSFLVLGAEPPWIYPLASELSAIGPTVAVSLGASSSIRRRTVAWPFPDSGPNLRHALWTYPPGFNGALSSVFGMAIRRRLASACERLRAESGAAPWVIVAYPLFAAYVRDVAPDRLVYWNYDDYSVLSASGRTQAAGEADLAERAGTILCSSAWQTERFRESLRDRREKVFHFPHGVHTSFLNSVPAESPDPNTVCSVGALTGRYDWTLIRHVVTSLPDVTFSFIGELASGGFQDMAAGWDGQCREVLSLPNVRHVKGLKHRETPRYYWRNAVNWMPYDASLPFVQACCPLKLTDGLASGRAMVSADVPECRNYPEWISIYHDRDEAVACVTSALARAADVVVQSENQVAFAETNTWAVRARTLIDILER